MCLLYFYLLFHTFRFLYLFKKETRIPDLGCFHRTLPGDRYPFVSSWTFCEHIRLNETWNSLQNPFPTTGQMVLKRSIWVQNKRVTKTHTRSAFEPSPVKRKLRRSILNDKEMLKGDISVFVILIASFGFYQS